MRLAIDAPEVCYRCNKLSKGGRTCKACHSTSCVYALSSVLPYRKPTQEIIHYMKYDANRTTARLLGSRLRLCDGHPALVTFVPTNSRHVRQRGFDHAKELAAQLALELELPLLSTLTRTGYAKQVGSSRKIRLTQLKGAFSIRPRVDVAGKEVLLVDDVVSTGASIEEATRALKAAGAKRIYASVVAVNYGR